MFILPTLGLAAGHPMAWAVMVPASSDVTQLPATSEGSEEVNFRPCRHFEQA